MTLLLTCIILFIWGEHNDTIIGKADGIGIKLGFDPELEISMRGHLPKNIYEPNLICNKKKTRQIDRSVMYRLVEVTFVADMISIKLR